MSDTFNRSAEPVKLDDAFVYLDLASANDAHPNLVFNEGEALAVLLLREVVFLNSFWFKKDWPEDAKRMTVLAVNCSDVFEWACADAENLEYAEIQSLYDHYAKDNTWGAAVWCIKKRKQKAQKPVYESIMKAGIWDLDSIYSKFSDSNEEELT